MKLLKFAAAAVVALGLAPAAQAQDYPKDIVRVVVGSSPGGTADTVSRLVSEALTAKFGKSFVVENLPGAGGALAAKTVKAAAPDGHTILFMFSSFSILPSLTKDVGYDPVADFAPITMVSSVPNALVAHPSLGVTSLAELVAKIKAEPGALNYGSGGIGFSGHLSMEMFLQGIDGQAVHIPYAGSGKLLAALISGEMTFAFDTLTTAVPHIQSGALIALGVTGAERSAILPDVPTIAEVVPGYELTAWNGFVAPAGTPPEVIAALNGAIVEYLKTDAAKDFFGKLGTNIDATTPEAFGAMIAGDRDKFAKVIEAAGIKAE